MYQPRAPCGPSAAVFQSTHTHTHTRTHARTHGLSCMPTPPSLDHLCQTWFPLVQMFQILFCCFTDREFAKEVRSTEMPRRGERRCSGQGSYTQRGSGHLGRWHQAPQPPPASPHVPSLPHCGEGGLSVGRAGAGRGVRQESDGPGEGLLPRARLGCPGSSGSRAGRPSRRAPHEARALLSTC